MWPLRSRRRAEDPAFAQGLKRRRLGDMVTGMDRRQATLMSEQRRNALDAIGGEALAGSGFERETPEGGFTALSFPVGPAVPALSFASRVPPKAKP